MSTFRDKARSKIYPDLNPTAPPFEKKTEIEAYLLDEIEVCERLTKNIKQFNTITKIVHTGIITSTVITGVVFLLRLQVVLTCLLGLH